MTRDEISALLPFLANDSLQGAERAEVEAAVADDPGLQAELAALKAIRATMQSEQDYSPGEVGLARLMREVGQAPAERQTGRSRIWQVAAAVLLAVVIGQAVLQDRGTDPDGFELAGTEAAFSMVVRPETTEAALRQLLLDAGVEIVRGPSALGIYDLALTEGVRLEEARAVLRASAIVESLQDGTE